TYYDYMKSYSPYDNVAAQNYPHLLITGGLNDPRVAYWEPAKWTAKLRDLKTDNNLLLLKTNMDAGHGGASGRYEQLKETAFEYAFLLDRWGMEFQ
ncbi:MAG: prolyl oligopeptidase family serine peptidase, partial [Waterburya sp.]